MDEGYSSDTTLPARKIWSPYENDRILPFPFISTKLAERLNNSLRSWYAFRWKLSRPFLLPIPLLGKIKYGELFIILPIIAGIITISIITFIDDEVEGSGTPPVIAIGLSFLFACHNSIITFFTGVPFERSLIYHKIFALIGIITGLIHGWIYQRVGPEDSGDGPPSIVFTVFSMEFTSTALTGSILQIFFILLLLFSIPFIRRHFFEVFYRLHWIYFLCAIGISFPHGAGGIIFGVVPWILDIIYRYGWQALHFYTHTATLHRLPANVIRITFSKGNFHYKSGQYIFLCIPTLSIFEWHPFSISSSPHQEEVTIHIRVLGNWTKKLYELPKQASCNVTIYMEGPYGELGVDLDGNTYKSVLLLSGGIGITPMQSIANDLNHQFHRGRPLNKCWFVWSVRDRFMIDAVYDNECVRNRLPLSFSPDGLDEVSSDTNDIFYTEFYLTKVRNENEFDSANIHPDLQPSLRFNRPNLSEIIQEMKKHALKNQEKRVAVLVCGPSQMVQDIYVECKRASNKDLKFDVHSETFEF